MSSAQVPVRLERAGGAAERAADAHDGSDLADAVGAGGAIGARGRRVPAGQVLLDRPRVQEREPGRDAPGRVPPDRGRDRRPRAHARRPDGRLLGLLRAARPLGPALQAHVQPVHRALDGSLLVPQGCVALPVNSTRFNSLAFSF